MGVLHHLPDRPGGYATWCETVAEDGIVFLYVYGAHGSRERMRRKQIVRRLLSDSHAPFEDGIVLVRSLGFDTFEYGWNATVGGERSNDVLIVDAYLNVNEALFDADGIFELMRGSGLELFTIFGLTVAKQGWLFEGHLTSAARGLPTIMKLAAELPAGPAQDAYERLSLWDRYRLVDLLYQPNGYTLLGMKSGATARFPPDGRVLANALRAQAVG
jgi:hypothetical protein